MKKFFAMALAAMLFIPSLLSADSAKGLNVIVTAKDTQAQMMAMVLSMATLKQNKKVNMTLCSSAGDLAIKGMKSEVLKPMNKSPKMMLQALIKNGAKVTLCPIYLPNVNKDKSMLIEGITMATPAGGAKELLDLDFQNLTY
jgi:predicted peroxiredoxin